jgi:hypothetical protein
MRITYCECVFVALGIQHTRRMRPIVICGLPRSTKLYHFIFKKSHDFREKKMCISIFSIKFVCYILFSKKNWARYDQNVYWSPCKLPVIFSDFNEIWIFSGQIFSRNSQVSNLMKIGRVGAEFFPWRQTDGRHDKDNVTRLKMKGRQVKDRREEGGYKIGIRETRGSKVCVQSWSQISADARLKKRSRVGNNFDSILTQFCLNGWYKINTGDQSLLLLKLKINNWKCIWLKAYFVDTPRNQEYVRRKILFII